MPTSYQPPTVGDQADKTTYTQSVDSALSVTTTPVAKLLADKGDAVFSVAPDDTILDAVLLLREKRIGAVLVLDETGALVGILSERDIVRKMADIPGRTLQQKVADLMTSKVETCQPEAPLVEILQKMTSRRFRHMPVVKDGKLLGIVTIGDVVHYRLKELEYEALKMKQMIVG